MTEPVDAAPGAMPPKIAHRSIREALYTRLRGRSTPLLVGPGYAIPGASLWSGIRVWTAHLRAIGATPSCVVRIRDEPTPAFVMACGAAWWIGCAVQPEDPRGEPEPVVERSRTVELGGDRPDGRHDVHWLPVPMPDPRTAGDRLERESSGPNPGGAVRWRGAERCVSWGELARGFAAAMRAPQLEDELAHEHEWTPPRDDPWWTPPGFLDSLWLVLMRGGMACAPGLAHGMGGPPDRASQRAGLVGKTTCGV